MKEKQYAEIICRGFCKFYKEGKEEIHCGGYDLLRENLTLDELLLLLGYISKAHFFEPLNEIFTEFGCSKCAFESDGCDFREGLESPPCGGYLMISKLLKFFKDLEDSP